MNRIFLVSLWLFFIIFFRFAPVDAQDSGAQLPPRFPQGGWTTSVQGGAVYQFDTDLDDGGKYNATRVAIEGSHGYGWDRRTSASLSLGYSFDGYQFSGTSGLAALEPWEDIHSFSLSAPLRWGIGEQWSAFFIPTVRVTGESGASFSDSLTGGGFGGAAYRVSDTLLIGPGLGVISQLEESATVFPILIVDWKITDRLSLETGRGLGATLGPGLNLHYQLNQAWRLSLGGRYEKLRFRLDENSVATDGVGEDSSFPLYLGATYQLNDKATLSLVGGIELGGSLRLEDKDGNFIAEEDSDTGGFLGGTFTARF